MYKALIYIRRAIAAIMGGLILLFFFDFMRLLPNDLHWLMHIQIVPALAAGAVVILAANFALTLLAGRLYCSIICPLGIMQDFIFRVKKWYCKIFKKKRLLASEYKKPHNLLRYAILAGTTVSFTIFGAAGLVLLLDPYSTFGRIVTAIFNPFVIWMNNLIAFVTNSFGHYSFYKISIYNFSWTLLILAAIAFIALTIMVWRRQRLWCNTICPVGALLGLFSRYSLVRVSIDPGKCTHCHKCTKSCKSYCIDDKQNYVDHSRCVSCYNCLGSCNFDAIKLKADGWRSSSCRPTDDKTKQSTINSTGGEVPRDLFLKGIATAALSTLPITALAQQNRNRHGQKGHEARDGRGIPGRSRTVHARPPGSVHDFGERCTACQLCVTRCPMQVIKPAFLENGLTGMMQPYLYFQPHCYCNYECTVCTEVCPNHALERLTVEQKKIRQIGIVKFIPRKCIVVTHNKDCGACAEHCPTGAVRMVPFHDGLTIPVTDPDICIGCGACESICPVRPDAIFVEGLRIQGVANAPEVQEKEKTSVDSFGF